MAAKGYIRIQKGAILEGVPYQRLKKRLQRSQIVLMNDREDSRQKLMPLTALSPHAYEHWLKEQAALAFASPTPQEVPASVAAIVPASPAALLQPDLPFAPLPAREAARQGAIPPGIPQALWNYLDAWTTCLANCTNGTWRIYARNNIPYGGFTIRNKYDFIKAEAHLRGRGFSPSAIFQKLKLRREVFADANIPDKEGPRWQEIVRRLIPKPKPGMTGRSFFDREQNAWGYPILRGLYLDWHKPSMRHAWRAYCDLVDVKQDAAGVEEIYEKPTLDQVRTALKKIPWPKRILGRDGEKAYRNRCEPTLSRDPDTLHSNDLWVTDQRVANVILQDDQHLLGRIWMVNDIDVASFKWMEMAAGVILNSDMVMRAHVGAMARYGLPFHIQHDQGKEFRATRFGGGFRRISRRALYGEAEGFWQRVGINPVPAIGGNPQTKTIERWHEEVDRFDKTFLTWCGTDTDERPQEELAPIIAQHRAYWFEGKGHDPHIPTIGEYLAKFRQWAEGEWNAEHQGEGKYLRGLTPNQAYMAKRPGEGFRFISLEELEEKSAEHRKETVRRGGQVNLKFFGVTIEYRAAELFQFAGAKPPVKVEVVISRCSLDAVTVWYPVAGGRASCIAEVKDPHQWLPAAGSQARENMRAALHSRSHLKSVVREGIKADRLLAAAANPAELLEMQRALPAREQVSGQKLFGTPAPTSQHPETGSLEYLSGKLGRREKPRFANERAAVVLEALGEEDGNQFGK
jgi:hypothetical protein